MDLKKILIILDCLPHIQGGAERQIFELCKGINRDKYCVRIASLETYGEADKHSFRSIQTGVLKFPVKRIYGISGLIQGICLIKYLKREKIDIVMTIHFSSDLWGTFWAKLAGVKTIISNRRDMGFWRSKGHIKAYALINHLVRKIIVNSKAARQKFCVDEKLLEDKFKIIHNGIDVADYSHNTAKNDLKQNIHPNLKQFSTDHIIMQVANITPIKNHELTIRTLSYLKTNHPNLRLFLIGEDRRNGAIQKLASDLQVADQIVFLGRRFDARQLILTANICLLTSQSEGLSNAIMEYMAAGKPVIATNVGGNPELIEHGITGFLVEPNKPEELAHYIKHLINNPNEAQKMGQRGYEKISTEFSLKKMVHSYETLFEDLLNSPSNRNS